MGDYDMARMLAFSRQHFQRVTDVLKRRVRAVSVEIATEKQDRFQGIDYLATLTGQNKVSVDLKVRQHEYPDLLLEELSVVEQRKIGWTLDPGKQTDYILYLFPQTDQLVPYPPLRVAFAENLTGWKVMYGSETSTSDEGSWHTRWTAVPDKVVFDAISKRRSGLWVVGDQPQAEVGPHCPKCGHRPSATQDGWDERFVSYRCGHCKSLWQGSVTA